MTDELDEAKRCEIHLLDVGKDEYGDAVLCRFGSRTVMIDGAHPGDHDGTPGHLSIPQQIETLLEKNAPYPIDLLIISHAHQDHIGCLPKLIADNKLKVGWILAIDPKLGWGRTGNEDSFRDADPNVLKLSAALREEIHSERGTQDAAMERFLSDATNLETRYQQMLTTLEQSGTKVVRFGNPKTNLQELENEFADINLKILGPSNTHLLECALEIKEKTRDSLDFARRFFNTDTGESVTKVYRKLVSSSSFISEADLVDASPRPGPFINLQSTVTQFEFQGHKFLFAGDFQFNDPQTKNQAILTGVDELKTAIKAEAPYSFVKLSHHGSDNAFSEDMLTDLGDTKIFGLCAGEDSTHHPARKILKLLEEHREQIKWARTDHNGLVTLAYKKGQKEPVIKLEKGTLNDAKPNFIDLTATIPNPVQPATSVASLTTVKKTSETVSRPPVNQETEEKREIVKVEPADEKNYIEITTRIPNEATEISFSGNFTIKIKTANQKKSDEIIKEVIKNEEFNYDSSFLIDYWKNIGNK
jgi:beta-lactamase superfamily II metal-dependent hydrolase